MAVVRLGQDLPVELLPAAESGTIPSYADPQAAARALAHAARRAAWLARPAGTVPDLDGSRRSGRTLVEDHLAAHPGGGWLDPRECADLLACYGIPQISWALGRDRGRGRPGRRPAPGVPTAGWS